MSGPAQGGSPPRAFPWSATVLNSTYDPVEIRIGVARGHVVGMLPGGATVIFPPNADNELCESLRLAREAAERSQSC